MLFSRLPQDDVLFDLSAGQRVLHIYIVKYIIIENRVFQYGRTVI